MTEYMILRGTGEDLTENLPATFIRPLIRAGDTVTHVNYPATIGPLRPAGEAWASMDASRAAGKSALSQAVARTPNIPVLVGFSLGAYVVSDYLEDLAAGRIKGQTVAGAILIASPRAPRANGREGIARAHGPYPKVPVCQVRNWGDIICNTPTASPLMKLTPLVSIGTGGVDLGWALGELLRASALPTATDLELLRGYADPRIGAHDKAYLQDPQFRRSVGRWLAEHRF
ncbi:lysin B [Gordonia phage Trine]|uniref:Lysin B n=1 Tax=Gordonia phage Trine TaxID=2201431 RepID=A0A2Z4QAK8_9CAUD|nr:lysin B [Gordonia phage Trine]AWY06538.1 lysin B [Gordonia phage Trine]